jgi:hypothetical protein
VCSSDLSPIRAATAPKSSSNKVNIIFQAIYPN